MIMIRDSVSREFGRAQLLVDGRSQRHQQLQATMIVNHPNQCI